MSNILYDMIYTRAVLTYDGPHVTAANYGYWVKHWFKTAEIIRCEFISERLLKTASAIQTIIDDQRLIANKYLGE